MISFFVSHAMTILAAVACGLALFKGGRPEREAGLLVAGAWIVSLLAQALCTRAWFTQAGVIEPYLIAGVDALGGLGFVILAVRHTSLWLGLAVLIQGVALALHAAFLSGNGLNGQVYVAQVNALGGMLLLVLLAATVAVWIRRSHPRLTPSPSAEGGASLAG